MLEPKELIRLREAAKYVPGGKTAKGLHRWATEGVRNRQTGRRHLLETIKVGGIVFTTQTAVKRFLEAVA